MDYGDFSRFIIINFIAAFIISVLVCFLISTLKINDGIYLGAFVGLYVFSVFGIDSMVAKDVIANDNSRLVLAIVCIIIYCLAFSYIIPIIFGPDVLSTSRTIASMGYDGIGSGITLNREFYLTVFSLIMLAVNYFHSKEG